MIVAFDVYYDCNPTKGVGITFNWLDSAPNEIFEMYFEKVEEYIPGQFYKRELPCILNLLEKMNSHQIEAIIIDGNVWVDNEKKPGLGAHLYNALNGKIPIVGVAKNLFKGCEEVCVPVTRGQSKKPLWVSVIGLPIEDVVTKIENMRGDFRIPSVLKKLDSLTRGE